MGLLAGWEAGVGVPGAWGHMRDAQESAISPLHVNFELKSTFGVHMVKLHAGGLMLVRSSFAGPSKHL